MKNRQEVFVALYRDGRTNGFQVNIEDAGGGYRILGPKFSGASVAIHRTVLTERDITEIRSYLTRAARKIKYSAGKVLP